MKAIFLLVSILVISLAIAPVLTHIDAKKDSNIINSIDKALRKYSDSKKDKDLCSVLATKKSDPNGKVVWNKDCNNTPEPPKPPVNKPPVLVVDSPIKCIPNLDCQMTIDSVKDPDGNITAINWIQKSGPNVSNLTLLDGNLSAVFIPVVNDTYVFTIKATDNNQSSVSKDLTVNVGEQSPIPCPTGTHREGDQCVPDPNPEPAGNHTDVVIVGDVSGTAVRDAIKKDNTDYVIAVGDLGYASSLSWYKTNYVNVFGQESKCVIGNHDALEDGSSSIFAEAKQLCGENWQFSVSNTTFIGINTNDGNVPPVVTLPKDTKNAVILSHKPCVSTPPNSHHPLESSVVDFCSRVKDQIPNDVKVYFINGHNHVLAENAKGDIFTSGAGGRSHYTCGTSSEWPFCNNQKYGYLMMSIDNQDGSVSFHFKDTNGNVIH